MPREPIAEDSADESVATPAVESPAVGSPAVGSPAETAAEPADQHDSVGAWAKKYHLASRALIEATLRQHDLGPTQWYVLYQLVNVGPTLQRDLSALLKIERATLSGVVTTLVRKGFVEQAPDATDQRQRLLKITEEGRIVWSRLPDPVAEAQAISFGGVDEADLETARRVLRAGTARLQQHLAAES